MAAAEAAAAAAAEEEEEEGGERDIFGGVLGAPLVMRGGGGGILAAGEWRAAGSMPAKGELLGGTPPPPLGSPWYMLGDLLRLSGRRGFFMDRASGWATELEEWWQWAGGGAAIGRCNVPPSGPPRAYMS